jgi:membrane dipeptidase
MALIDAVAAQARRDERLELATTADQVRAAAARGHVAALLGVEGGHAIENSLEHLETLYRRGVRYLTLVWNNGNDWAGSSLDARRHGGLSAFGREVVARMNALGMLVDVSHASDNTFWDVVTASTRPIIASHSCCRALAAHPRNLTDDQLRAVARTGGVVGINFFPVFHDEAFRSAYDELNRRLEPRYAEIRARHGEHRTEADFEITRLRAAHLGELPEPTLDRLLDHVEHAVQVMGAAHVGIGSDFDGITVLPAPLKDATSLPLLIDGLRARGCSDSDVRKICGENFLRLLSAPR